MKIKSGLGCRSVTTLAAGALVWALFFANVANAQATYQPYGVNGIIDAGTTINVRTNEKISTKDSDGRVFSGYVDQDVVDRNGNTIIPKGSAAELLVRKLADNQVVVDLDSITVNGVRYSVDTEGNVVSSRKNEGFGVNKRTGTFVGGGAALGAIIGAIGGGGKGAAIGAGAGAAAGAGAQLLTRGDKVNVPAESLLTFRLTEPLRAGVADTGYTRNGLHYHQMYGNSAQQSAAYREGLRHGRSDAERNLDWNMQTYRWNTAQDRADYEAGYNDGYNGYQNQGAYNTGRQKPGYYGSEGGTISIGADNSVTWQGPENSSVYVQMDNQPLQLFAHGQSGVQNAYWMNPGHVYVFILKDAYGNEIARDRRDMRNSYRYRR